MKIKTCSKCKDPKLISAFTIDKSRKDGHKGICKKCDNERHKLYYKSHRKECLARSYKDKRNRRVDRQTRIAKYLLSHPCVGCGEKDIIVLDFDHRNPKDKTNAVSKLADLGYSWKIIEKEIAKCDVKCANCHKKRTANQQNWLRVKIAEQINGQEKS